MFLTQALHRTVQQTPDEPYSICDGRTVTHAENLDLVARTAGGLVDLGVASGDRVALLGLNSDRYLQMLSAVSWAGAVMVPLNVRLSVTEMAYALNQTQAGVLVVDDTFVPIVPAVRDACPTVRVVVFIGRGETPDATVAVTELLASAAPIADTLRRGDDLAGIFHTGGTTGNPKGVMLSHRNMLTSPLGACATGSVTYRGRILHVAPLFHLAALSSWVTTCLVGGTHVLRGTFDPVGVLADIQDQRVTDLMLVPTMISMLVEHPDVVKYDLSSVTSVTYGASPMTESLLDKSRALLPQARFTQAYGMTELAPVATMLLDAEHNDPVLRRSVGRAAPHVLLKVVDPSGVEVPTGTVGEIVAFGDNIMLGYWANPDETREALRDGWMHTGDGGYLDDEGYLFLADRLKDMIISGGENVYSIEVENAVAAHPAVVQCAVIGVPDATWGERVHAIVVLAPGATLTLDEMREHCRGRIAGYKIPTSLESLEAFPISAAGKILKRELRERR